MSPIHSSNKPKVKICTVCLASSLWKAIQVSKHPAHADDPVVKLCVSRPLTVYSLLSSSHSEDGHSAWVDWFMSRGEGMYMSTTCPFCCMLPAHTWQQVQLWIHSTEETLVNAGTGLSAASCCSTAVCVVTELLYESRDAIQYEATHALYRWLQPVLFITNRGSPSLFATLGKLSVSPISETAADNKSLFSD